jgi:hypothetical protein
MENYTITKEQILQLNSFNNYDCGEALKQWFPSAFKQYWESGKWYFVYDDLNDCNALVLKGDKNDVTCGFWLDNNIFFGDGSWINLDKEIKREATPQEVETALINEAKKRGFKEGCSFNAVVFMNSQRQLFNSSGKLDFDHFDNNNVIYIDGYAVFENGKWAEILPQPTEMTVEEIEAKLGYSIKIVN